MAPATVENDHQLSEKGSPRVLQLAVTAVMAALVFAVTFPPFLHIPLPGVPQGYFNFGDVVIFTSALTFGPVVGGFAGGVGSSLADAIGGSPAFAPFTLIVKGSEGLVAGYIAQRGFRRSDLVAWVIGGSILVTGYFITVSFLYGLPAAVFPELPTDIAQALSGGIVGIPASRKLRTSLPAIFFQGRITGPRPPSRTKA